MVTAWARDIATELIHRTVALGDGYALRDVLAHGGCAAMLTEDQARALAEALDGCALGHQKLPAKPKADLSAALDTSETVMSRALTTHANA